MHEQSETVQLPNGKWINVYGKKTKNAGKKLPGEIEHDTVEDAVDAAKKRSKSFNKNDKTRKATLLGQEIEE